MIIHWSEHCYGGLNRGNGFFGTCCCFSCSSFSLLTPGIANVENKQTVCSLAGLLVAIRYLSRLSWVGQHAHVYQKVDAGTFMLDCLKITVLHRIRLMIYNNLVRPYFEYCIKVWGCTKVSDLKVFF